LSYDLADKLYQDGLTSARAITGMHAETQRVDPQDNHFIADITYVPAGVFKLLPVLNYNGMLILDPLYQRIDLHSALSFPYDDSPREVIFARWQKDIKRFNQMDEFYPVSGYVDLNKINDSLDTPDGLKLMKVSMPVSMKRSVMTGFLAYAVMCQLYLDFCKSKDLQKTNDLQSTDALTPIKVNGVEVTADSITFSAPVDVIELIDVKTHKRVDEFKLHNVKKFEKLFNLHFSRIEGVVNKSELSDLSDLPSKSNSTTIIIYDSGTRLMSTNSVHFGEKSFRIANLQYQLKSCLANYFIYSKGINTDINKPLAEYYLLMYDNLIKMLNVFEEHLSEAECENHPFFLSINTFGIDNINETTKMFLKRIKHDLHEGDAVVLPINYYPEKNKANNRPRPVPDYANYEFTHENGTLVQS
jgi:hypothetical protein